MKRMSGDKVEIIKSIPAYLCDPKKNIDCRKTACGQECFRTLKQECSLYGEPFQYIYQRKVITRGTEDEDIK